MGSSRLPLKRLVVLAYSLITLSAFLFSPSAHATITYEIRDTADGLLVSVIWDGPDGGVWELSEDAIDNGDLFIGGGTALEVEYAGGELQLIRVGGPDAGSTINEGFTDPARTAMNVTTPFAKGSFTASTLINRNGGPLAQDTQWTPDGYWIDSSDSNGWVLFTSGSKARETIELLYASGTNPDFDAGEPESSENSRYLVDNVFAKLGIIPGVINEFWLGELSGFAGARDRLPIRLRTVATASLELRLEASGAAPFDVDVSAVFGNGTPHAGDVAFAPGAINSTTNLVREDLMGNQYRISLNRNAPADDPPADSAIASVSCTGGSDAGQVVGNELIVNLGPEENTICTLTMNAQCGASDGTSALTAPSDALCAVGTPSAVSGDGPWNWTCGAGVFGSGASCSAALIPSYPIATSALLGEGDISCTPNPVPQGATANCTATPAATYAFVGFSGDCAGNTCSLPPANGPRSVGAAFSINTITSAEEDASPNGGDGNDDGIPDSTQANVASLIGPDSSGYLTLEVSGGCSSISAANTSMPSDAEGFTLPVGLLAFSLPCETADIRVLYHGLESLEGFEYRKFGPTTPGGMASEWYTLPGVVFGQTVINGNSIATVSFSLADNLLGDATGDDGLIIDPGAPATMLSASSSSVRAESVPTLPLSILLATALGLIVMTLHMQQRRKLDGGSEGI